MENPRASGGKSTKSKLKIAIIAVLAVVIVGGISIYSGSGQGTQGRMRIIIPQIPVRMPIQSGRSGLLNITLADDTPLTKQIVAGTSYTDPNANVAKFKLSASNLEDIYLSKLIVSIDSDSNDSAVAGAALYGSTNSSHLGDLIGTMHSLQSNGSNPGFIQWDWAAGNQPKIALNSSYYITVKANIVSSGQAVVSGKTPRFILSSVEAEGADKITPTMGYVTGNVMQILNTKLMVSTDTKGLDNSTKLGQKLAKVVFTAAANPTDTVENYAVINKLRINVVGSKISTKNYLLYPDEQYNNSLYAVKGKVVSNTVVEFNFADANADGIANDPIYGSSAKVLEGTSRMFDLKADTISGTNGSLDLYIANTGTSSTAVYGVNGDISWSDDAGTTVYWLNQIQNIVSLRYFYSAVATGTP